MRIKVINYTCIKFFTRIANFFAVDRPTIVLLYLFSVQKVTVEVNRFNIYISNKSNRYALFANCHYPPNKYCFNADSANACAEIEFFSVTNIKHISAAVRGKRPVPIENRSL